MAQWNSPFLGVGSHIPTPFFSVANQAHSPDRATAFYAQRQEAILLKVLLRLVPTAVKAAIATTAINAAISAYSIAVTPDTSLSRFEMKERIGVSRTSRKSSYICNLMF
jgi:hypothetical protein